MAREARGRASPRAVRPTHLARRRRPRGRAGGARLRRRAVDAEFVARYHRSVREDACFICEIAAGGRPHHMLFEDDLALAFLNRFPTLPGYALVAPRDHREHVVSDFDADEYVALQRVVHRVGRAVQQAVGAERLYVASLGSMQGNRHVHWHLAPLPPGVPYERQQLAALDWERAGMLEPTDDDQRRLAKRIRGLLDEL